MYFQVYASLLFPRYIIGQSSNFKQCIHDTTFLSFRDNKFVKQNKNIRCIQVSTSPESPHNVTRRSADFKPCIWGDFFISFTDNNAEEDEESRQRFVDHKEEVRRMILSDLDHAMTKLYLIDAVQRLGVSYHFEEEIDEALRNILDGHEDYETGLYNVTLKFRLLRQQGHFVSCDVFEKFRDNEGKFKECLISDARGMLSLYEATHLGVLGEEVLDEALTFTTTHLQSLIASSSTLDPLLKDQISHALYQPLRTGLPRLEARHYMDIYEQDASCNELLLTFAKLDFNLLQKKHQNELAELSRWWKDIGFATKLPFARDRLVENYFLMSALYHGPQQSLGRILLTKASAMVSVIDDLYDVYGTAEELALFTDAIEKWDVDCLDQLPEYMQLCYTGYTDVYKEIEETMALQGKSYLASYIKQSMIELVKSYSDESKWFDQNYTPTMEEYSKAALLSAGMRWIGNISFVGMEEIVTKESFEWLFNFPKIVEATSLIGRFMDDIVSYKFEKIRGHSASSIECYMKEHSTATEEEAINELRKRVKDAWKVINRECLTTEVPMPLPTRFLNLARLVDVVYKDEDGYTNCGIKDFITSLFVDSVPI